MYFSCQEKKKERKTQIINRWRQSNHYMSTRATPHGKEHD
jgi:hypothetical protein